jgi:cell division protein ZapA
MSDLSIKVNIAGRVYPLTIDKEEEEVVRKAAAKIEESIHLFQKNYAVKDKQDLLAMSALQLATKVLKSETDSQGESQDLTDLLNLLDQHLD